jgi:3-oxoacyl-[acyl-carrier protein] reductase
MDLGLANKKAVIVGASEGIGFASAMGLAQEGVEVFIVSRSLEKLEPAAEKIRKETGAVVHVKACDITKADEVEGLGVWLSGETDYIDILVTAVGGSVKRAFDDLSDDDWLANYEFNILGNVRLVRSTLPFVRKSDAGTIVIVSAAGGKQPYPNQGVSNVHKAGVFGLTKTLAGELVGENIRVNSVAPGRTVTSLWTNRFDLISKERGVTPDEIQEELAQEIPIKRFGQPEEIANVVVFMCSEKSSYMVGQSVSVDGGMVRGLF